ncbi:MAG: hypothetical protein JWS12_101 [Candidatus Saccharibacteria bacterium]|nr:hypothetical protein [Candidatus Saccharibacteria bacterium]
MPRIGEVTPRPVEALNPYLTEGITDAVAEVCESLNKFDPLPFGIIPDFLNERGLSLLEQLDVPMNGKCPEEALLSHPVGGPLAQTMGRISLANMDLRHDSTRTTFSLKNETGENVGLEPHRDLLDGHAILFNYAVSGDLYYVLDGKRHRIKSNELVVLNGAALWGDITNFLPGEENNDPFSGWRTLGGVTMVHAVESKGFTSRNRLLAYAEGPETLVTQILPKLPSWF